MDRFRDTNWFAVHAKTRRESFAAANVSALALDVFLPMRTVETTARGNLRETCLPLFPSYFFARFSPQISLEAVSRCLGVLRVVSSGRFPIPVNAEIIGEIQDRVGSDGLIRLLRPALRPGDVVSIERGPLQGIMGKVERELDDRKRVAIFLDTLWQARVIVERNCLERPAA